MKHWQIKGFEDFSKGTFENGGQNLYVSRKGVLQRIWRFDVNNDGYVDLPVANSHDYNEHPDLHIIWDPLGEARCQGVLTQGAQTGAVGDINGDGFDDLVIGTTHDGQHTDLASYVYFGGKGGITENRKIDLAAPSCTCCGIGDFDGDGKKEICYLVADGTDASSAVGLHNIRLRVYGYDSTGFRMNGFRDYPMEIAWFSVADIDGDGCDDLYCRTEDGRWIVLWGSAEGFSLERSVEIGAPTDDMKRFNLLPPGGGNLRYTEMARSRCVSIGGKTYLFYADAGRARLIGWQGRMPSGEEIVISLPNVMACGVGRIMNEDDLVLVQVNGLEEQRVLVFGSAQGYRQPVWQTAAVTPRDVMLSDFSGNGRDDLVVVQGRNDHAHTTESLLFETGADGTICAEPRRFTTHNCVAAFSANFAGDGKKSLVFVNQQQSSAYGHIPVYIYLGSKDGYKPENRLEFPGHSAGTIIPVDINDDGWPDILVMHNAEDQPFLSPPADLYWGSSDGFTPERKTEIYSPLAWGGHCADLNKDGYLDLVSSCGNQVCIQYGGPDGFSMENMTVLNPIVGEPAGAVCSCLWPAMADLTGDGWLDLVVPISMQGYSRVYWGGPEGFSDERSLVLPVDYAITVRIADLNNDGYPDLVFGSRASYFRNTYHEGAVTIFWGGPDGYSGFNCCVLPTYEVGDITVADLDNDGWLDIFVSTYFNKRERDINSFIYWNDHGNFSLTNRKRIFAHSSSGALAGDFNEDGYVDLFVTNHRMYGNHRTESAIWWNGPDGFTEEKRTWLPTIGPHDLTPNDIGNVMTRGEEEYYITPVCCLKQLHAVGWEGEIPAKTWVNCQIRTGATPEELEQKSFVGADGTENSRLACGEAIPAALVEGNCVQIKVFLGAVNSGNTPRLVEIYTE